MNSEEHCPRCGRKAIECRNVTPARFRYDVTYNGPIAWQYICECGHRWEGEVGLSAEERALVVALEFTESALLRRYKTVCPWCSSTLVEVAHPNSHGICDDCLERTFPEDAQ
jgi:hypothetical protein